MSLVKNTEEVVQRVLKRLSKTKELSLKTVADDSGRKHQLESEFQTIEEHLRRMDAVLPQVKRIEKELIERFMKLEREIDDDVYKNNDKFGEIVQNLQQVVKNVKSVEDDISSVKLQLNDADANTSASVTEHEEAQSRMASEGWSQLISKDTLFRSQAMQYLQRNFNALGYNCQLCLLSLSIFPENCVMKKRAIVCWWIGEGLVAADANGDTAEEVGDSHFQKLINRRLIKAVYGNESPIADSCSLLPWIRSALIFLARQAEVFDFDDMGRPRSGQRQAFLMSGNQDLHPVHNGNGNKADTLVTVYNINQNYLTVTADLFSRWKKVVVLQLGRWQISPKHHIEVEKEESLKGLRSLKHLRYLSSGHF